MSTLELFRRHTLPLLAAGKIEGYPSLFAFWAAGTAVLALSSAASSALGLNFASTAFVLLLAVVTLSVFNSLVSSIIFSVFAVVCLNFSFVHPLHTLAVDRPRDVATLCIFLASSLSVAFIIRLVHALSAAERKQPDLLDLTSDAVFVRDADDVITYWNRGAEELYGWSRKEAIGRVAHELLATKFPVPLPEIDDALRRTGRWDGELAHTTRSGATISVASRWSRRLDERGNSLGTLECDIDLSESRRARNTLDRSQAAYLAEAQKLSQTGSFGWKLSTGELFWSDETFRIFGVDPSTRPSLARLLQQVHPDDLTAVSEVIARAETERRDFSHEHRVLLANGETRHIRIVARYLEGSEDVQFFGAVMDITAQRKAYSSIALSEQRYRQLFERMPIALWRLNGKRLVELIKSVRRQGVTDLDAYFDANPDFLKSCLEALVFEEANDHAVQLFGGQSASAIRGRSVVDVWQESPSTYRRAMVSRFNGASYFEEETKVVTFDGRVIDVLFTAARLGLGDDPDTSLVGMIDISERVEAERRLQQVQAEFARAARLSVLGELTASIAHEINQPLAAIANSGAAGLRWISRPVPDIEEVRECLSAVMEDVARVSKIIARIRATANGKPPEKALLDLDEVIEEALTFLRTEIRERSVTVRHERSKALPKIVGDRTQIHQVIVNLAMNAIQAPHRPGTQPRILISSGNSDSRTAICTVEDNGSGLDPDNADRLFESFFTTKEGGMGMGLRICRSIVEAHGGRITADTQSNLGGARFSVFLPAPTHDDAVAPVDAVDL